MKVLNYTTSYFAVILLILISIWAGIFYYAMLDEIYDSIDDGLDNQKGLIIQKVATDSTILRKSSFEEGDYAIIETSSQIARNVHDVYVDTMMYMQNEEDFEPVRLLRTTFYHNGKYYQMQIVTSMVEEDDLIAELFYALLWLYIGLVASILILNNFLLKRIWMPFYHLLKQLKKFKLENPSNMKVKKTRIDEFKLLNEAVQKLLKSNIDSYNSQKNFIENAAHELQTPLAISINKLEALAETSKLSENELKLLASAIDNLERLTRLNKSLLLLSRIENKQFLTEEEISINDLVKKIADDFSDQLTYREIVLSIDEQGSSTIKMNPDLGVILITNLIKNAIVHNHPNGLINVIIKKTSVSIENAGREEALDEQNLFTRFNKKEQSETSTGLGLAIVKAITELYSFNISYFYTTRHKFTVYFK
jgi:signal transduction histidine kinase